MAIDEARFMEFLHRFVGDLGATAAAGGVVIGDRLGLYRALAEKPLLPQELAERTDTVPRYVEEWLRAQAAGGYVEYDGADGRYSLTEEQAFVLTNPDGPVFAPGAFQLALAALRAEPEITNAFRSGDGFAWHRHDSEVFLGCERFFRPGYSANLVQAWLPTLSGMTQKLEAGARVADIGCGHGASTIVMAQAFPKSSFIGLDYHDASIATARKRAAEQGVTGNIAFEVKAATEFDGHDFDLICFMDCLHDLGDPVGALARCRATLKPDGKVLLVEPYAGDRLEENLNPIGRMYYAASAMACTPNSLSQEVGLGLGAQAGEERLRKVAREAGFSNLRRAAQTPVNLILELTP